MRQARRGHRVFKACRASRALLDRRVQHPRCQVRRVRLVRRVLLVRQVPHRQCLAPRDRQVLLVRLVQPGRLVLLVRLALLDQRATPPVW